MKVDTDSLKINSLQLGDSFNNKIKNSDNQGFESFFNAALGLYDETNKYQLKAEQLQLDFVTGKSDDLIGLSMAQSRASSSLQFTTQVTNKIISAYQEIMRIQM